LKGLALRSIPGKKRKGGKSRAIGISGLGRFFLFFPDFVSEEIPLTTNL
jgi:hypothetical protein